MRDEVSFLPHFEALIFIHAQIQEQKLDLHKILEQRAFLPSEGYMNIWGFYFALKIDLHILKPVTTERAPGLIDALAVQSWDQGFESNTDARDSLPCQREAFELLFWQWKPKPQLVGLVGTKNRSQRESSDHAMCSFMLKNSAPFIVHHPARQSLLLP